VIPREYHELIPSTQTRALELVRAGAPEGTRVVAGTQNAGRGRLDHGWESPPGGLYLSLAVRLPPEHPSLFPIALGAALSEEVRDRFGAPARLKWPNDLVIVESRRRVRKLAGLLVDRVRTPVNGEMAVIGVGVNVTVPPRGPSPELVGRAAWLSEFAVQPPSLHAVEECVVAAAFDAAHSLSRPGQITAVRARCRAALYGIGRTATVDGHLTGTIDALGDEGELWLATATDRVAIQAGDLKLEESP
jgi:BirA family transcriptional regulator, biotin operon repressor / biotin---[acetyl-CoA-carboxylase] ligase